MIRRCEPLFDGDDREVCGARFDDARRMAVCPHVSLDGGDVAGVPGDYDYLVSIGARVARPDDGDTLSPELVAFLERSEGRHTIESQAARYVLVDVLDLAALLGAADHARLQDGALFDRVEKAPMATVPCTIKLNEDGGVWITPDEVVPAPDPRKPGMVSRGNLLDLAPHQVRTYGVYPASSVGEVVGFLNAHRELTPVAIIPESLGTLMVLYVEVRP